MTRTIGTSQRELIRRIRLNLSQLANTPANKPTKEIEERAIDLISQIENKTLRATYEISYEGAVTANYCGDSSRFKLPPLD